MQIKRHWVDAAPGCGVQRSLGFTLISMPWCGSPTIQSLDTRQRQASTGPEVTHSNLLIFEHQSSSDIKKGWRQAWELSLHFSLVASKRVLRGFPSSSAGQESTCNAGNFSLIPGREEPLEKGTPTHSSILAWRIP